MNEADRDSIRRLISEASTDSAKPVLAEIKGARKSIERVEDWLFVGLNGKDSLLVTITKLESTDSEVRARLASMDETVKEHSRKIDKIRQRVDRPRDWKAIGAVIIAVLTAVAGVFGVRYQHDTAQPPPSVSGR